MCIRDRAMTTYLWSVGLWICIWKCRDMTDSMFVGERCICAGKIRYVVGARKDRKGSREERYILRCVPLRLQRTYQESTCKRTDEYRYKCAVPGLKNGGYLMAGFEFVDGWVGKVFDDVDICYQKYRTNQTSFSHLPTDTVNE